jgi:glycosyltransferase involved in cell wall biosynthesis
LHQASDFKFDEGARAFYVAPMSSADKVAVVIPCLNESKEIFALVSAVRKFLPNVIVVDDGSTDETSALATKAGAEVLRNKTPLGKGMALNLGFQRARERSFSSALAMDGDGQHAPNDIPKFLAAINKAPLVIGNRMENCARMPWLRRFVNRWMSERLSRIAGKNLPDTQCGFRLIDLEAWSQLELQTTHFEIESELVLSFAAAGHAIEFVPIEVIYKNEQSKIHPVRDTVRWFRWWRIARRQFQAVTPTSDFSLMAESITRAPK